MEFRALCEDDLVYMHLWLNKSHVRLWYSKKKWTYKEVVTKYTPIIEKKSPIEGYIAYHMGRPLGYIQCYPAQSFLKINPFKDQKLKMTAGLDLFIGEEVFLGKWLSKRMILEFLQKVVKKDYTYCIVDPEEENDIAIRLYQRAGFRFLQKIYEEEGSVHDLYFISLGAKLMDQIREHAKNYHPTNKKKLVLQDI